MGEISAEIYNLNKNGNITNIWEIVKKLAPNKTNIGIKELTNGNGELIISQQIKNAVGGYVTNASLKKMRYGYIPNDIAEQEENRRYSETLKHLIKQEITHISHYSTVNTNHQGGK